MLAAAAAHKLILNKLYDCIGVVWLIVFLFILGRCSAVFAAAVKMQLLATDVFSARVWIFRFDSDLWAASLARELRE